MSRRRHTWYYFNSHFSFRLHFHWTSFQDIHQKLLQPACRAGSNFPAVGIGSGVCTGPCMAWHKQEDERATSMGGLQVLNRTPGSSRGDCCPLSVPWQQPGDKSSGPCQDKLLRVTGVFPSSPGKCWLQEAFCMELMGHQATPHCTFCSWYRWRQKYRDLPRYSYARGQLPALCLAQYRDVKSTRHCWRVKHRLLHPPSSKNIAGGSAEGNAGLQETGWKTNTTWEAQHA